MECRLINDTTDTVEPGNVFLVISDGVDYHLLYSDTVLPIGVFTHVAVTFDGTYMRIYINGVLDIEIAQNIMPYDSPYPVQIGSLSNAASDNFFNGVIDEVRIFNRSLAASEIQDIFACSDSGDNSVPIAIAGTSLDGNDQLQLDATLSFDPDGDSLTYSWEIEGEVAPRLGQIVSIADLAVGSYSVDLTVSDGFFSSSDTLLFGIPEKCGVDQPNPDALQQAVDEIKSSITDLPETSFDAPNSKVGANRKKTLLNMFDKVFQSIGIEDFQGAIDQLRDILEKSDGLEPPVSAPDWIVGSDTFVIAQAITDLIDDLLAHCSECS